MKSSDNEIHCCPICNEEMHNNPHNLSDAEIDMIENLNLNVITTPDILELSLLKQMTKSITVVSVQKKWV